MPLAKRIIPCLDVDQGQVVKGVRFVDIRVAGNPIEVAARYDKQGADELAFLDITASSDNRDTLVEVVEKVADQVFIPLTVGGGIRTLKDITLMLNSGADKVSINTTAVLNPDFIREASDHFGNQCIVVAIDAKRIGENSQGIGKWEIYTCGGRNSTGIDAVEWAGKMANSGAGELLVTSMDRDGTRDGLDLELMKLITNSVNIPVIASGGVGNLDHLADGVQLGGVDAVLAASIFHYGEYTIQQAKQHMAQRGIEVRL